MPNTDDRNLEEPTLSRAIQLCANANRDRRISLELLDGSFLLSFSIDGFELLSQSSSAVDSFFFPYESTKVLGALLKFTESPKNLEILAYVGCMAMGGVEQNTIAVLKAINRTSAILATKRPEVNVGDLTRDAMKAGIPVITLINSSNYACDLHAVSEKFKIDWLWVCNWSTEDEVLNSQFHALERSFRIADQRSYDHESGWINTITMDYVKRVDVIIATNAPIKLRLTNAFGEKYSSKIQVIRSALRFNHAQVVTRRNKHSKCIFYQISRIVPQKRIDRGQALSNALKSSGFEDSWRIVGDGYLRPALEITSWDNEFIEFLGFQDSRDALENACGLVQTSDYEGLPLVVIEALALGIPVFSTNTGDLGWLREQLPEICRPMLNLVELDELDGVNDCFIDWRLNFESVCNSSMREITSTTVKDLFGINKSAAEYSRIFQAT
jgi:glycosyltransferase involved in cell wall biosynthesis